MNIGRHQLQIRKWRKRARIATEERDLLLSEVLDLREVIDETYPNLLGNDPTVCDIFETVTTIIQSKGANNVQDKLEGSERKDQ